MRVYITAEAENQQNNTNNRFQQNTITTILEIRQVNGNLANYYKLCMLLKDLTNPHKLIKICQPNANKTKCMKILEPKNVYR